MGRSHHRGGSTLLYPDGGFAPHVGRFGHRVRSPKADIAGGHPGRRVCAPKADLHQNGRERPSPQSRPSAPSLEGSKHCACPAAFMHVPERKALPYRDVCLTCSVSMSSNSAFGRSASKRGAVVLGRQVQFRCSWRDPALCNEDCRYPPASAAHCEPAGQGRYRSWSGCPRGRSGPWRGCRASARTATSPSPMNLPIHARRTGSPPPGWAPVIFLYMAAGPSSVRWVSMTLSMRLGTTCQLRRTPRTACSTRC